MLFRSVRGQRFDVAALAFGVDGVEGERGLTGAGEAGDDREGIARDADVDVAQVMLARSADGNVCDAHGECGPGCFEGQVSRIRHSELGGGVGRRSGWGRWVGQPNVGDMYPKVQ